MKWLTPIEQKAWIGLLFAVEGITHASERQLQRDSGISFATYGILAALSEGPEMTLHMTELAGIAGHSQSRLSHAVARLEMDGLIKRSQCPGDRRAVHATLTAKGQRVVRDAAPAHVTAVRELVFDRLGPEQAESLAEITGVLYDALITEGYALPVSALGGTEDHQPRKPRPRPERPAAASRSRPT